MSVPRMKPPSTQTCARPATACTICGRTAALPSPWSSWRPPWLETVDHLDAVLHGDLRVFGGGDALDDERYRMLVLEALYLRPGESRLETAARGRGRAPGLDEAADEVALAPAVHRDVHGEAKGAVAVGERAAHVVVHPGVVAAHVELEDAQRVGRGGGFLQAGLADRGEHLRHAETAPRRAPRGRAASTMDSRPPIGARNTGSGPCATGTHARHRPC
jgi:hypothetical protein